ncbi:hypothetical protein [Pontibacter sp. H249]|uniref:hypothetical protein n=1 Tax=Pontibacter sp. H249 TaxID=3133420 RepID=UPI0030BD39B7
MDGKFQYSVLKYRHSYAIGEVVNLGILFLFEDGEVAFSFPNKLSRLSQMYSHGLSLNFIKKTLASFDTRANKLNRSREAIVGLENDLSFIIGQYFLPENASSLFFSDTCKGLFDDKEAIIEYFSNFYLGWYNSRSEEKKDDKYIVDKVKSFLKNEYSQEVEKKMRLDLVLTDSKNLVSEKFEYGWQNGTLHLITPISLDLANEQYYDTKALKWRSLLGMFKPEADSKGIKFDILVAKPTERSLFSRYDKAMKVITDSDAPITTYEEDKYDEYLDLAAKTVLSKNE